MNIDKVFRHPSSFRDPDGYVFFEDQTVGRHIRTEDARDRMRRLLSSTLFQDILAPYIISSHWDGDFLRHEKVPVATYPYEWSFNILKDAALGQLTILEHCVQHGFILKDGSALNTLFNHGKMVFVDILSIADYQTGQIWEGYAQFCKHFLFPLMLQAKKNIFFQPLWRGSLDGITLDEMNALLGVHRWSSLGSIKHIVLQHMLSRTSRGGVGVRLSQPTMPQPALLSFIRGLRKLIASLRKKGTHSTWEDYVQNNTYTSSDQEQKETFIKDFLERERLHQIVDLGCNTGHYSRLSAPFVERVIAVDYDPSCIDILYSSLSSEPSFRQKIVPMVGNLMNPSPALGWNLEERCDQLSRLQSDSFLALALIHHICITENVPLEMFVALLRKMGRCGVVEWVSKKDPMVQTLLKNRKDVFEDYTQEHFDSCLKRHFKIQKKICVNRDQTRTLYWLTNE